MVNNSIPNDPCRFSRPGRYSIEITQGMKINFEVLETIPFEPDYETNTRNSACAILEAIILAINYVDQDKTIMPTIDCSKCRKVKTILFKNPGA